MTERIENWLGNVTSQVEGILRPGSVPELQQVLRAETGRLLVMGARMSKTALLEARAGRALDVTGLAQILEFGDDNVTVQAGISVYELSRALYGRGRQLPGFTITANPTIGGMITAPTKGSNHPWVPRANSVSGAILSVKVVRPDGQLVEFHVGEHDDELSLLRDSYGAVGVVVEAKLRTLPLVSAEVQDEIISLQRLLTSADEQTRALEHRALLFPKLGAALIRMHHDVRESAPTKPFEELLTGPLTPYVRLANRLPTFSKRALLSGAVRLGVDRKRVRKFHVQNLTVYPKDGSAYLDFITWSLPIARYQVVLPRIMEYCRTHPAFPAECLVEVFRVFPERRFLDSDERVALDPVSFDRSESARWEVFYREYNRFMLELGASPFLNQTRYIGPEDMRHVYGERYDAWRAAILAVDPQRKLGSVYLDRVLGFGEPSGRAA